MELTSNFLMHSSSLHHHLLIKKTKVLLAGSIQQATYLSLGCIFVLSMSFDWTGWIGEINTEFSTPACRFLPYSFSDKFKVYTQHVLICLKSHPNLSVAAQKFARSTTELLRQNISLWSWAWVCRWKERHPSLQNEPRSGGGSVACWSGSVHLNPRNAFVILSKVKGINPIFLPGLTG